MHDFEKIVSALKDLRDEARHIEERGRMAIVLAAALREATGLAWDSVRGDPDDVSKAARFLRLYTIMPKD